MSDFALAQEAVRTARGAWTQRQDVAAASSATISMNALETAISFAVAAGNTGFTVNLPPSPVAGDVATLHFKNNASKGVVVTDSAALYNIRTGPTAAGEKFKALFSSGRWQASGP